MIYLLKKKKPPKNPYNRAEPDHQGRFPGNLANPNCEEFGYIKLIKALLAVYRGRKDIQTGTKSKVSNQFWGPELK